MSETRLERVAAAIGGLRGVARWLAVLGFGAVGAAAMPPWHILPAAFIALVGLVWMLDGARSWRQALMLGWAWGFGHFTAGCYWIIEAYFVPPADFAALGPPMVLGLAVMLGAFVAAACALAAALGRLLPRVASGWRQVLMLAVFLSIGEWARSWVLTGFPWNPIGQVWAFSDIMLQSVSLWGVDGLGLLSFCVFALPATAAVGPPRRRLARWLPSLGVPLLLIGGLYAFGAWRLAGPALRDTDIAVRIVQPNIPQGEKWRNDLRDRHIEQLIRLGMQPAARPPQHIIWPETAVPFALELAPDYLRWLGSIVPPDGYLLTGAPRTGEPPPGRPPSAFRPLWNSLLVIQGGGQIVATYDKAHLVPFGEYLPLRRTWPLLGDTIGRGSFEAGPGPRTVAVPGLPPFGAVICYEVIFSGEIADRGARPAWLLNITNDSWFGSSSGPYQHLTSARLRAIEEGLPMLRAANTGVSAVIDAHGRLLSQIDMQRMGVIDHAIPAALPPTWFVRYGMLSWLILLGVLTILGCILKCHTRTN